MLELRAYSAFMDKFAKKRIVLALIFVALAALSFSSYYFRVFIHGLIESLAAFIDSHAVAGAFIFVFISGLAAIFSPFSSIPMIPSAVIAWGGLLTFIFLLGGWVIGSVLGYFIAYYAREKFLEKYFRFEKIDYYKNKISSDAQFFLVLIFRLAIPTEITAYALGIIKYDFKKFLIISLLAETPFALIAVYSSAAFYAGDILIFAGIMAFTLIMLVFFSVELKKRFRQ